MTLADVVLAGLYVLIALALGDFAVTWSQRRRPVRDDDGRWRMPTPRHSVTRISRAGRLDSGPRAPSTARPRLGGTQARGRPPHYQ